MRVLFFAVFVAILNFMKIIQGQPNGAIALRRQAKNSTGLRDICVRSDKLSQAPPKLFSEIFFSAVWQNFSNLFTQEVNL